MRRRYGGGLGIAFLAVSVLRLFFGNGWARR